MSKAFGQLCKYILAQMDLSQVSNKMAQIILMVKNMAFTFSYSEGNPDLKKSY